jgi:hypothetical protein
MRGSGISKKPKFIPEFLCDAILLRGIKGRRRDRAAVSAASFLKRVIRQSPIKYTLMYCHKRIGCLA